ncbi:MULTISPECIES: HAMP domain-containing sensor histidine kinase [unclassified Polynucleobacter]|uniref:sensor histidine kinase n=1 Tax=unclassified Polynucleobacter TaxID=2640945 RepID=UPI0008B75F32|nr:MULTISPECIES: HAMP domain-containing sensor histidine kinase [unclassified Polynucleobacter]OHC10132.1 MAG: two-component sensor histidine kinase [Polynucleobacter sp. GWA2_45_21]HBK43625.1 sensor histidine kinase [Polynucleobacter sp.]
MKLLIALYFFILAMIQLGLLLGIYHYHRSQSELRPNPYWMGSLILNILALVTFGGGIMVIQSVEKPEFNFTIANSLFYIAAIFQLLFCKSLIGPISKRLQYGFALSAVIFIPTFEFLRIYGNYEMRTTFMCVIGIIFFSWQIMMLRRKRSLEPSQQLMYMQYATAVELCFSFGRLGVLASTGFTISKMEQLPQLLILLTVGQLVVNTLSYIALGGYWAEKVALANTKSKSENDEIKVLLIERENLISNLLKANKTAATGALSASIAHELNQPLGASQLNIQFLQRRLSEGHLTTEQNQEILTALLADNQRATNIIQSLRSIFSDGKIGVEHIDIAALIESVLKIAKPEIQAKNIQVVLDLNSTSAINVNRGEIEQVLLNLINNAIQALSKSTRSSRTLQIESRDVSGGIQLLISDNGGGVPIDARMHLFELLSNSNKRSGMGLGLWLCQHIVSRHGGRIRYEDAPSGGAQFTVFLPSTQE